MVRTDYLKAAAFALGLVILPTVASAVANKGDYLFCHQVNLIGAAGKMERFSDREIMNGLCLSTDLVLKAIVAKDDPSQSACLLAAGHTMREFKRRFPGRDAEKAC